MLTVIKLGEGRWATTQRATAWAAERLFSTSCAL